MVAPFDIPVPTKQPGQRSLDIGDVYLLRNSPTWMRPNQYTAKAWRGLVYSQPIAMVCREFLIANLTALDWKISAVDSEQQDELKGTIKYYTSLLEKGGDSGMDFTLLLERVVTDLLDIPFGGAAEIGRKNDAPNGRVAWIHPIDGGTLYPTLNNDYPVVQYLAIHNPVIFPKNFISRMYLSPRTEIEREGWGMAPPEKIYFALTMIGQGDGYYANLLLDIPPVGILDLMDMEKSSAIEWVNSYRDFLASGGQKSFKIPVLYEHTQDVKFISLGKAPNDIMYDRITLKYAEIVCAGYGLSLSDIGIGGASSGGGTLAGSIRQDRTTRNNGKSIVKRKVVNFINSFLPESIRFAWIDYDDELNVALGRARLANSTAAGQWIKDGVFGPDEMRRQAIADGLMSISLPESLSDEERKKILAMTNSEKSPERPGAIGTKEPASKGGMGEVMKSVHAIQDKGTKLALKKTIRDVFEKTFPLFSENSIANGMLELQGILKNIPTDWLKLEHSPRAKDEFKSWLQAYALQRAMDTYQQDYLDEMTDDPEVPYEVAEDLREQVSQINIDSAYSQFQDDLRLLVSSSVLDSISNTIALALSQNNGVDFGKQGDYTNNMVSVIQKSVVQDLDTIVEQGIETCLQTTFNNMRLEIY